MSDADDNGLSADPGKGGRDRRIRAIRSGPARPAPGAAPKFSQPVRQIIFMLIVLVLVGIGGWFAYGRILSVFLINPALNGFIFLVFVIGVLTCFWQVGQLVNSVSWIERFASRRRNATEAGVTAQGDPESQGAPRLLAPLAALLGALGPGGGAISTASSRSILDSVATRIDELRDITRYMSNLLIFLGLLGTFYGLSTTVPAVVDTIRALQPQEGESGLAVFEKLMSGLEGQLGGMGTAFSSSLLGLAGSLVVGMLELFVTHGQNRFFRELEEWMSGFTRVDMGGTSAEGLDHNAVAGFLDQVAGQMSDLHEYYLQRDEARAAESAAAEDRIRAMTRGIEGLTAQILTQSALAAERAELASRVLTRMADGQERLSGQLLAGADQTGGSSAALARLADGQDHLAERLLTASAHENAMGATLARIAQGQERLIALAEQPAQVMPVQPTATGIEESDLIEARMHLRSLDYQLSRLVEELAAGRADMAAELRQDITALTRAIRLLGQGDAT